MGSKTAAAELENPHEFPDLLHDLWFWFGALVRTRQPTMAGPGAITESEIRAFCLNRGIRMEQWQLDAIARLDSASREDHSKPKEEA